MLAKLGLVDRALLNEVSEIIGRELGWDEVQREKEIVRTIEILSDEHRVFV